MKDLFGKDYRSSYDCEYKSHDLKWNYEPEKTWQDKVEEEKKQLEVKIKAIKKAIISNEDISSEQKRLLDAQMNIMKAYVAILEARLELE